MIETIRNISTQHIRNVINLRRELHRFPELSFQEVNTAKRIEEELKSIGVPFVTSVNGTGVIGIIEGGSTGKTLAIRAELDALPINEETGLEFSSIYPGVMHACGHDVHMANLIGVAKTLWEIRSKLKGKILLVFQPGEELLPGGALGVIESEVFQNNFPDVMLGLHILPELPLGTVGFKSGFYMASGDEVYITVHGKGGHAALPHTLIDPVLISSHIIVALQQVVSRKGPSSVPSVLSFGKITSNGANNVIPNEVFIEGTFRTMDETWRKKAHQEIEQIATGIAKGMGGECDVEIRQGYPTLFNNPELTRFAADVAEEFLGSERVVELPIRMTTDDFAHYAARIPSVYFRVGAAIEGQSSSLHSAKLVISEDIFEHSVGLTALIIYSILNNSQKISFLK